MLKQTNRQLRTSVGLSQTPIQTYAGQEVSTHEDGKKIKYFYRNVNKKSKRKMTSSMYLAKVVIFIVKSFAFTIVVGARLTIGLSVWIAAICRVIAVASFQITVSLIGHGDAGQAAQVIEKAASIWPQGLNAIIRSFWDKGNYEQQNTGTLTPYEANRYSKSVPVNWGRAFFEIIYSIIFYSSIIVSSRYFGAFSASATISYDFTVGQKQVLTVDAQENAGPGQLLTEIITNLFDFATNIPVPVYLAAFGIMVILIVVLIGRRR